MRIPIGISDFKKLRTGNYSYIDKTRFIIEVLNHPAEALLFPRPRRFGKTLNLSMLRYFLEQDADNRELFSGLEVEKDAEIFAQLGTYPTIFLSFKDLKCLTWSTFQSQLIALLSEIYLIHKDVIETANPLGFEQQLVLSFQKGNISIDSCLNALALLSSLLHRATGKKVVVLIDEYDTPIHAGYQNGYYREVVSFMRSLLGSVLKDNGSLEKGVLTGILRVARESIFSGLNNLDVYTLLDDPFSNHFGFTQEEVDQLLDANTLNLAQVRDWYNGYRFGSHVIYNPWSILKVAQYPRVPLQPHWVNTSDNELIRRLVVDGNEISALELDQLLAGGQFIREVDKAIVFERKTPDAVWSLLLFSGYLTSYDTQYHEDRILCDLRIPNREVRGFFVKTIRDWVGTQTGVNGLDDLFQALSDGDIKTLEAILSELILQILSYHDLGGKEPERVYHVFFLGLLVGWRDRYEIQSNRESGWGRYDLCLFPRRMGEQAYIFEFKRGDELEKAAEEALAQIERQAYFAAVEARGHKSALLVGVGLNGKGCKIASRTWTSPQA